jgi:ABC-2 type transport system permease protein
MSNIGWIARRELAYYLRSPVGWIVIAAALAIDGFFFNVFAVGSGQHKSSEILEWFFLYTGGSSLFAAAFISMRLFAEERQTGTIVLLLTSPIKEFELVAGKFLSALIFLMIFVALTPYMPALILLHGKVSLAHILAGYFGVFLVAAAGLALGLLCSALAPNQLVAIISAAVLLFTFVLFWALSKIASPPVEDLLAYLSIFDKHFRPFMRGLISIQDVVFYVSLTYVALLTATRVMEARRWH